MPLSSVAVFKGGGTPPKDVARYWTGEIPWVSPKDMKYDRIDTSLDKITLEAIDNSAAALIPEDSLLIVVRSGILARTIPVAITQTRLAVNQDIKALVPGKKVDCHYLHYFLRSAEPELLSLVTRGATVHRLSTDAIKSLPMPLPPLPEQKRTVAILDAAFEGIDTAMAYAEQNLGNAHALFESCLSAALRKQGEGWQTKRLNDHVRFVDYRGKTPRKTEAGIRLITAKNVRQGFVQRQPEEFIDPSIYDAWMIRGFPQIGDVLFTTEAPLGYVAQLDTDERVVVGQRLITMQPDPSVLDRAFLKYTLMSRAVQSEIHSRATGATVLGIKAKLLKQVPITFPKSLAQQREIAARIDETWDSVLKLQQLYSDKRLALARLKQSLLRKAFAGELTTEPEVAFNEAAAMAAE